MADDIYLDYQRYNKLVDALLNVQPCPVTGEVTPDQIKLALGLAGDIWPMEIRGGVILDALEHAEKQSGLIAAGISADPDELN